MVSKLAAKVMLAQLAGRNPPCPVPVFVGANRYRTYQQ